MKRVVCLFIILSSAMAQAAEGLYTYIGLLPYYWKQTNADYELQEKLFISTDTGLGYILSESVYLGGTFHYTTISTKTDSDSNPNDHQYTYQMYGPSVGWIGEQWFVIGSYYAYAEQRDQNQSSTPQSTTIRSGTGFGVNFGYRLPLWGFEVGPMLAFKSLTYVNCKDPYSGATNTCNPGSQQTEVTPYFAFLFNFK